MPVGYKTVEGLVESEFVEKKSRFISHLAHVEDEDEALAFIGRIKDENKQARHNVYAYLLRKGRTRYSDDGEPAQTAGLPTFEVLEHSGLEDVAIVTTRYFGGILLGTGGLVRAYTKSAQDAVSIAHVVTICPCIDIYFDIPYSMNSAVQKVIADTGAEVLDNRYSDSIAMTLRIREENADRLRKSLTEATRGQVPIELSAPKLAKI